MARTIDYTADPNELVLTIGGGAGRAMNGRVANQFAMRDLAVPLDEAAVERLAVGIVPDCIVVEAGIDGADVLPEVLAHVDTLSRDEQCGVVVVFPRPMLDSVAAGITDPHVLMLCEPDMAERAAAIALAARRGRATLRESLGETEADRLQRLTDEVGRIARALADLSEDRGSGPGDRAAPGFGGTRPAMINVDGIEAATIRTMIRARRMRDQFFGPDLFADPAWDMLLDLMAARVEGRQVAVSSLCIAAAVPPTTALRWISTMVEAGLFERRSDPVDRRRVFMALSERAVAGMGGYFAALKRTGLLAAA